MHFLHTIEPCQQEPSFFEALDAKKSLSLAKKASKTERFIFPGIHDNHGNKNKHKKQTWQAWPSWRFSLAEIMAFKATVRKESNLGFNI